MPDSHLWRLIQSWMDGQIVRVNQSQLADALGVNRQSLSQWKQSQARPSPANLRALRRVTRLDWNLLTDALLRDMGYVEDEETSDGTATKGAGATPATDPTTGSGGALAATSDHFADPGVPADFDLAADEDPAPPRAFDDQSPTNGEPLS